MRVIFGVNISNKAGVYRCDRKSNSKYSADVTICRDAPGIQAQGAEQYQSENFFK